MEYLSLILILVCGLAAGFINVMAGGGSVLTVSALIFSGLDANVANGTNRVGIFVESGSAFLTFKKAKVFLGKKILPLALSAIPGAILGASYAIHIDEAIFQKVFAGVIVFVAITIFKPSKSKESVAPTESPEIYWYTYPLMFLVGIYGGFVQAGVGFLIISTLKLGTNASLVQISAIKSSIVFLYTIPALIIFIYGNQVAWLEAMVLALGFSIGARISAKTAVKKGDRIVKRVLGIALFIVAVRLFTFLGLRVKQQPFSKNKREILFPR